jgi:hypothetical protein
MPTVGDPTTVADPSNPSMWWATNPAGEGLTYEQLKQRRAVAAAMASRSRPYPTTIGQGIASLGESVGNAMYEREILNAERSLKAREKAGDEATRAVEPPPTVVPGRRSSYAVPAAADVASYDGTVPEDPVTPVSAGPARAAIAATIASRPPSTGGDVPGPAPMLTRMAALDTGTVSDAGQPGATYGGPAGAPAGPGASMAEPPVTTPPSPSVPPTAAAALPPGGPGTTAPGTPAPAGGGASHADIARTLVAQAGEAPRIRVGPPVPTQQPPGQFTQPPRDQGIPKPEGDYLPPGVTPLEPLGPRPTLPKQPQEPGETPAMRALRETIQKNKGMVTPEKEASWQMQLNTLKAIQEKSHAESMEKWKLDYAQQQNQQNEWDKRQKQLPQEREKAAEATRQATIAQRFGDPETHKKAVAEASASADAAKTYANALPNFYKALDIARSNKPMIVGPFAQQGIGVHTPWGSLSSPSGMTAHGVWSRLPVPGSEWSGEAVANTQEFRALLRPLMKAMLGQTTGAGSISNVEVDQAAEALGLRGDMSRDAIIKVLENWGEGAHRAIGQHNSALDRNFPRPQDLDAAEHRQYKVQTPFEPIDVKLLRAEPGGLRWQMFEQRYGRGSAQRALQGEDR